MFCVALAAVGIEGPHDPWMVVTVRQHTVGFRCRWSTLLAKARRIKKGGRIDRDTFGGYLTLRDSVILYLTNT